MSPIDSEIQKALLELRARMQDRPALAAELKPLIDALEALHSRQESDRAELAHRLRVIEQQQRALDVHVSAIENSLIFRILRAAGKPLLEWKTQLDRLRRKAQEEDGGDPAYEEWFRRQEQAGAGRGSPAADFGPRFTVVLRVRSAGGEVPEAAIESVVRQTYPRWELWIEQPRGEGERLRELAAGDPRIRLTDGARAAAEGSGEYVVFLEEDGVLSPVALQRMAEALRDGPADLVYTDEDRLTAEGRHVAPVFKPGWSPDLLLSCAYMGQSMAVSREAMVRAGGLRDEFGDAALHDLALRLTDGACVVRHVPEVLYHGRGDASRPVAASRKAIEDALRRRKWAAAVEDGPGPGGFRIRWETRGEPLVSIAICSRSAALLGKCLDSMAKRTAYARREIVVVHHAGGKDDAGLERAIAAHGGKRIPYTGPFDFAKMNNLAARAAGGEILVFLNDDVEPLDDSWLTALVGQLQRPDVGAAGARLLYPSGTVQHAGITIGIGDGCGHVGRGTHGLRYWPWLGWTRDVSAVTGACLAVRRAVFEEAGGFDERFPVNYNDVDLCLRVRRAGRRVVYESAAVLRHHECQTRVGVVSFEERQRWYERWAEALEGGDPYYSPNLTRMGEDASLG